MNNTPTTSYAELNRSLATPTKETKINGVKSHRKPITRDPVSVEFAAKQLFEILLANIKYNNAKSDHRLDSFSVPLAGI